MATPEKPGGLAATPPSTPAPIPDPLGTQAAAASAAAATRASVEDRRQRNVKAVEDRAAAMEASNRAAMKRMDSSKPTPTQRENDLAKLGVHVEEKEDHGGEDEQVALRRTMEAKLSGEPYATRDVSSTEKK